MAADNVTDSVWEDFHAVVNMTSRELRDWLGVEALDPDVGDDDRELGRRVLEILGKRRTDLTHHDADVMPRVIARLERLRGDTDAEPVAGSTQWRHRLMTLGHDPLKP